MYSKSKSIFALIYELKGRTKGTPILNFSPDQLLLEGDPIKVKWFEKYYYLSLRENVHTVLITPDGKKLWFESGGLLEIAPGVYKIKYFNMRIINMLLPNVEQKSNDGWPVRYEIRVKYEVTDPIHMLRLGDYPDVILRDQIEDAVKNFILSKPHDRLVGLPGVEPIENNEIIQAIKVSLEQGNMIRGFNILDIAIKNRDGHSERTERAEKTSLAIIQAQQESRVKSEELRTQLLIAQQEKLVTEHKTLAKEQERVTLTHVNTELAEEARKLEIQNIELDQMRQSQSLKQERYLAGLENRKEIISRAIDLLGQSPGLRSGLDPEVIQKLLDAAVEPDDDSDQEQNIISGRFKDDDEPRDYIPPIPPRRD
ncbi:SPFH domain-containing protein [Chloroflexota bacterium]